MKRDRYKIINKKKRFATIGADIIGNLLFSPFHLFCPPKEIDPEKIRSILVIRTAYIGDVVMTLPLLQPLKALYPGARVTFLTSRSANPVLKTNPYIDRIMTYDPFWFYPGDIKTYVKFIRELRQSRFDLVIEARGDIREFLFLLAPLKARYKVSYTVGGGAYFLTHPVPYKGLPHKVDYHIDIARFLGWKGSRVEWDLYLTTKEKAQVKEIMAAHKIDPSFVAAHPGSRLPMKCLSAEKYAQVYDALIKTHRLPVVLFGSPQEAPFVNEIMGLMTQKAVSLVGTTSLRQMAGLIAYARLFICNDSAPMHIAAAATDTPVVAVFGPSKSIETGPFRKGCKVVEKPCSCRVRCDESHCSQPRFNKCMADISAEDVLKAAEEFLNQERYPVYDRP